MVKKTPRKVDAHKCPEGNTVTSGRERWYPNFTSFLVEKPFFDKDKMRYLCFGSEICPKSGKHHWQGCVYFKDKVSIKMAQKLLKIDSSHMEYIQKSDDPEDAITYCKKEGKFEEYGEFPKQGKRMDLIELRDQLVDGSINVDEIIVSNPMMYHQYGRTLDKIEDIILRKKYRTEMTKGIWYWGSTGCGKSHTAYTEYSPETHYNLINDNGWWDGYRQQKVIVINDFRGWMSYNELLRSGATGLSFNSFDALSIVRPINKEVWTVYYDKVHKIGCSAPSNVGTSFNVLTGISNNDYKVNKILKINLKDFIKTKFSYSDTLTTPNNTGLYLFGGIVDSLASDTILSFPPVVFDFDVEMSYEDA